MNADHEQNGVTILKGLITYYTQHVIAIHTCIIIIHARALIEHVRKFYSMQLQCSVHALSYIAVFVGDAPCGGGVGHDVASDRLIRTGRRSVDLRHHLVCNDNRNTKLCVEN